MVANRNSTDGPKHTRYQQAMERLGELICSGSLKAGDVIPPEPELGDQLGVSRIVVREVVKSLAAKGMLEARRRTGTVVLDRSLWNPFDPDIISWRAKSNVFDAELARDLLELRRIIEPAAARMAAARATNEERATIRQAITGMQIAIRQENEHDYVTSDFVFHSTILWSCHNQFVKQMHAAISTILRTSFEFASTIPGGQAFSLPLHETLCEAIEDRNQDGAEQAMLAIVEHAENEMTGWFKLRGTPVPTVA